MLEFLQSILQESPIISAAVGVSGAGLVSFWIKDVPRRVFDFTRRNLTTQMSITSFNDSFHEVSRWISENYQDRNFRSFQATNGGYGDTHSKQGFLTLGYGSHYMKYKGRILRFNLSREETPSYGDKQLITITKLGRSRKLFDTFLEETRKRASEKDKTKLFKMEDFWSFVRTQQKRDFESIYIPEQTKRTLLDTIDNFLAKEDDYMKKGIPYQLGIMLYGPPGTGKTSIIKGIASYLDYPIYYLPPANITDIEKAVSTLPEKSLLVIEDIDSNIATKSRKNKNLEPQKKGENSSSDDDLVKSFTKASLSEILNAMDGLFSAHGRILLATTNHLEDLDEALIRPGRIDLKVLVDYMDFESFSKMYRTFFNEELEPFEMKEGIVPAEVQNKFLTCCKDEIIKFVKKED